MKKPILSLFIFAFFIMQVYAQDISIPQLGMEAPSFKAMSTEGQVKFPSDYGSKWKILLSHPKDFTPVCSSELLELAHEQESFAKLNTQLVVISTDNLEQHTSWKTALEEISYKDKSPVEITFPLVEDADYSVSRRYGMLHSKEHSSETIRGVFFIDPENTIRSVQFYPMEVGRNVAELKRTLLALQHTYGKDNEVTPANWNPGEAVIVTHLTSEDRANIGKPDSPFYQYSWFLVFKK